jgi:hypothetical protein
VSQPSPCFAVIYSRLRYSLTIRVALSRKVKRRNSRAGDPRSLSPPASARALTRNKEHHYSPQVHSFMMTTMTELILESTERVRSHQADVFFCLTFMEQRIQTATGYAG